MSFRCAGCRIFWRHAFALSSWSFSKKRYRTKLTCNQTGRQGIAAGARVGGKSRIFYCAFVRKKALWQVSVLHASVRRCYLQERNHVCGLQLISPPHIDGAASKFLGMRKILPEFLQTCLKSFFCNFCLQIFSHNDHEVLFLVWLPKKGLHVFFCKRWAPFMPELSGILPKFWKNFPRFLTNQNFRGCAYTLASSTTVTALQSIPFFCINLIWTRWMVLRHKCLLVAVAYSTKLPD